MWTRSCLVWNWQQRSGRSGRIALSELTDNRSRPECLRSDDDDMMMMTASVCSLFLALWQLWLFLSHSLSLPAFGILSLKTVVLLCCVRCTPKKALRVDFPFFYHAHTHKYRGTHTHTHVYDEGVKNRLGKWWRIRDKKRDLALHTFNWFHFCASTAVELELGGRKGRIAGRRERERALELCVPHSHGHTFTIQLEWRGEVLALALALLTASEL